MANYKIERTLTRTIDTITVSGDKGTYTHDYNEKSIRTKAHRIFIAQVLRDYGTQAINDIMEYER